jgi:hypothetical protein
MSASKASGWQRTTTSRVRADVGLHIGFRGVILFCPRADGRVVNMPYSMRTGRLFAIRTIPDKCPKVSLNNRFKS